MKLRARGQLYGGFARLLSHRQIQCFRDAVVAH
jgi:hypothetical protein